ncbi:MAG: ankyrin repeat domain-containing protein [Saprospiraceae bacterium]|jgi:ankyrin repeat protein|nr:ankyrin repeat domain-containing protein [Candidatus Brachybacter algidus]MBP7306828.1 ankyrin repeat domain-containing protein [Saprospiraceae bacterium]
MRIKVGGTLSSYNFLLLLLIVNIMFYCPVNSTAQKNKSIKRPCYEYSILSNTSIEDKLLYQYCGEGNLDKVKQLFAKGARLNTFTGERTPLRNAISSYNLELVKYLLDNGALPYLPYCWKGENMSYHSSIYFKDMVKEMKDYKLIEKQLIYADQVLTMAMKKGYPPKDFDINDDYIFILEHFRSLSFFRLYDKWKKDGVGFNDSQYLYNLDIFKLSLTAKDTGFINSLIIRGLNVNCDRIPYSDNQGEYTFLPLVYYAIGKNDVVLLSYFLNKGGNPNYTNPFSSHLEAYCTPLTYAIHQGNKEMVQKLIEKGALIRINNCGKNRHVSPIDYAMAAGKRDIVEYLLTK